MEERKEMVGTIKKTSQSHNYIGIEILIEKDKYQNLDPRKDVTVIQE